MCFRKRKRELNEKLLKIENSIQDLREFLANNQLQKLQQQSKKLLETEQLLKNVKIKVKNASYFEDDSGNKHLRVSYNMPTIIIDIDDNFNMSRNEMFRSVNLLDLVDANDWNIIQKEINKINKDKEKFLKTIDKENKSMR